MMAATARAHSPHKHRHCFQAQQQGTKGRRMVWMVQRRAIAFLLLALVATQQTAWAWGNDGHMYVNRVAAEKLPPDVPAFLRNATSELAYLGPEPDRWRDHSDPA